jgi:hypothetical protein
MDGKAWAEGMSIIDKYAGWHEEGQAEAKGAAGAKTATPTANGSTWGSSDIGGTPPTPGSGRRGIVSSSPPLTNGHEDVEMTDAGAVTEKSQDVMQLVRTAPISEEVSLSYQKYNCCVGLMNGF